MAANKFWNTIGLGMASIQLTGVVPTTGGAIVAIPNPDNDKIIIVRSYLHIRTPSTGAANISIGIAADAVTSASDIINALAVNGAITDKTYNGNTFQGTTKTEVTVPALWTTSKFLTVSASGDTTGLDAVLYVEYMRVGSKEIS